MARRLTFRLGVPAAAALLLLSGCQGQPEAAPADVVSPSPASPAPQTAAPPPGTEPPVAPSSMPSPTADQTRPPSPAPSLAAAQTRAPAPILRQTPPDAPGRPQPPGGASSTPPATACADRPLTHRLVDLQNISNLNPVGTLVPPDHTFPTPHMYFYVKNDATPADIESPVYAPGDIVFTSIALRRYDRIGSKSDYTDWPIPLTQQTAMGSGDHLGRTANRYHTW